MLGVPCTIAVSTIHGSMGMMKGCMLQCMLPILKGMGKGLVGVRLDGKDSLLHRLSHTCGLDCKIV